MLEAMVSAPRLCALVFLSATLVQAAATPEQLEFFEKKIRPVLAERCYACHSADTMAAAELRVDTREAIRRGGTRGPAVAPGAPAASTLLRAIEYADLDLKMPPDGKLSESEITDFRAWIEMGAPDPREDASAQSAAEEPAGFDWEEARKFWAYRPIEQPAPPAVHDTAWPANDIDRFLLARIEDESLSPASPADKRTLIRRVTYDLTGLPPTPAEVQAFLADDSPNAWEKLVERLLASPHYGERWARHWLDLVRFAETNGHEYDNDKPDAWRYRDYVVRAFNEDLPYDQFVREQIAGDLLNEPRLTADGSRYEAPIAAGMYWLWEVLNSPTDSIKSRADQVDNQIDVVSKAFFGLTLACARCHDHKFDPLPTADYYALAGVMHSTELRERDINSPERRTAIDRIRETALAIDQDLHAQLEPGRRAQHAALADRLLSDDLAEQRQAWAAEPDHPLYPLAKLAEPSDEPFAERVAALQAELEEWTAKADPAHPLWAEREDEVFDDFQNGFTKWDVDGAAFGAAPVRTLPTGLAADGYRATPIASSYPAGEEFVGLLTTPKFRIPEKHFMHVRMAGTEDKRGRALSELRVTLFANDYPSQNLTPPGNGRLEWISKRLVFERGRLGKFQIVDRATNGHIAVDRIVFSNNEEPPPIVEAPDPRVIALLAAKPASLEQLAEAYVSLADSLLDSYTPEDRALAATIEGPGANDAALDSLPADALAEARRLIALRSKTTAELPETAFAMSSQDHQPRDVRLHNRGNHKNLGDEVPRGFLTLFAGEDQKPFRQGSGRLELAQWATSDENPLTARVMVNRVWKQHFGHGLVRSPDNFGEMGERPTHPELLDYLSARFIADGWSVKDLHRSILYSKAYRMDSIGSDAAAERDPTNKLLSYMPVRRLEAEAIRDAILSVSGALDPSIGGPSVMPHISEHQDGRGKPKSGPLDGDGRRSIYINVRRNFLTPMFLAFDYPSPFSTIGRRGVSAVPSQALILLNNELVNEQAQLWAQAELERHSDAAARINDMFERAYSRPPTEVETEKIAGFLNAQQSRYDDAGPDDPRVWKDLAHVLINATEFIFVR